MSTTSVLRRLLGQSLLLNAPSRVLVAPLIQTQPNRDYWTKLDKPKPGIKGKSYRRIVHFKDKYTIEPLEVTNLAGRDPVCGRVVAKGIGGGIKHKYHWINWKRDGPTDVNEPPKEERVLKVFADGCRTCHVALVGSGKDIYYILATTNMKAGDLLKVHKGLFRMTVQPNEGDCYALGSLPVGTQVNCVEKYVGLGGFLVHAAGTFASITRKEGDRVIIKVPSKKEFSLDQRCMATVGRLSNELHNKTPIGSAAANRHLGNRPRSGLWHRKTGRHGRKIKPIPPVRKFDLTELKQTNRIQLTLNGL